MKTILLVVSLSICYSLTAQEKITLNTQDGIQVTYELTKMDDGDKKDTYLVIVKAENTNSHDVYYSVPMTKQANGTFVVSATANLLFAQTSVRNSTSLFGDHVNLKGTETKITTNDNKLLYTLPKGAFISGEQKFKVKKGAKPVLTNTFLLSLKPLDYYDVAINETMINGDWVSDCGNIQMNLTMTKNEHGGEVLQQLVNGKQNNWVKKTAHTFEKTADSNANLSFNKTNGSFTYTNTDGVLCVWKRK
jgi:hypothetical protein